MHIRGLLADGRYIVGLLALGGLILTPACTRGSSNAEDDAPGGGGAGGGSSSSGNVPGGGGPGTLEDGGGSSGPAGPPPRSDDGILNGTETDVDCGGASAPKCVEGKSCIADGDCVRGACNSAKKCIDIPSCKPHLGGDTCGLGEVGEGGAVHESCCRTLPVPGFADPAQPGKQVYLDKYEITVGRVRAFLDAMAAQSNGVPDVRDWILKNPPAVWDQTWNKFLPADADGETMMAERKLLGDPRGTWADAPPVPPADEPRKTGTDFQFNGSLFMYLHANNCSTHSPSAYGFPTFFYPANVLAKMGPQFPARADGTDGQGKLIPASEHLEVKAMNCITNAMLQAFCHWDGGQLATDAVLDFVTASPPTLGSRPGCGTQSPEYPPTTDASMKGGRCADLGKINATYDAGNALPTPNHPLNVNNYVFPFFPTGTAHDKAFEIAAPGRGTTAAAGSAADQVRINPNDEPWMDLAGNLIETVLKTTPGSTGTSTGKFTIKYRGIGYESARSKLNFDPTWDEENIARVERPQAKAAFAGGRCMRFK